MPIDPQIALHTQTPQIAGPTQALFALGQVKDMQQDQALRAEQIKNQQALAAQRVQAEADDRLLRSAIAEHTSPTGETDYDSVIGTLKARGAGPLAQRVEGDLWDMREKIAKSESTQIDQQTKKFTLAKTIVGSISDAGTFSAAKRSILNLLGPQYASAMGNEYDPERISELGGMAEEYLKSMSAQSNALKGYLDVAQAVRAGTKTDLEIDKMARDMAADHLMLANDPTTYSSMLKTLESRLGGRKGVLSLFPQAYDAKTTPEFFKNYGMTANEKQTRDEVNRHNKVMERVDQAREARLAKAEGQKTSDEAEAYPAEVKAEVALIAREFKDAKEARNELASIWPTLQSRYPKLDLRKGFQDLTARYGATAVGTLGELQTLIEGGEKPAESAAPATGAQAPARQVPFSVGQTVNLKGVGKVKITKMNDDGTFEYEPVK